MDAVQLTATTPPTLLKVAVRLVARGLAGGVEWCGCGDRAGGVVGRPTVADGDLGRLPVADGEAGLAERPGDGATAEGAPVGVGVRATSPSTTRAVNGAVDRSATCSPTTRTAPQATPVAVATPTSQTPTSIPGRVTPSL